MDVPEFALLTGAASGIGKACAAGMALLGVNDDTLTAVKAHIDKRLRERAEEACQIRLYTVDVTNEDQVDRTVQYVARNFGRLDYYVNAADIAFAFTSDWTRVLDVLIYLISTSFVLRATAKIILQRDPYSFRPRRLISLARLHFQLLLHAGSDGCTALDGLYDI